MYHQLVQLLDRIDIMLGPEEYAEYYDHNTFLKMPYNAVINIGYLFVWHFY